MTLKLDWPLQTTSGLTVILLPDETPSAVITGTYGPTGTEYGAAWDRDGKCISRDDASLALENAPMKTRVRWLILCNTATHDYDPPAGSERVVYDGRLYESKQAAEAQVKRSYLQNSQSPNPGDMRRYDLKIALVEISEINAPEAQVGVQQPIDKRLQVVR